MSEPSLRCLGQALILYPNLGFVSSPTHRFHIVSGRGVSVLFPTLKSSFWSLCLRFPHCHYLDLPPHPCPSPTENRTPAFFLQTLSGTGIQQPGLWALLREFLHAACWNLWTHLLLGIRVLCFTVRLSRSSTSDWTSRHFQVMFSGCWPGFLLELASESECVMAAWL